MSIISNGQSSVVRYLSFLRKAIKRKLASFRRKRMFRLAGNVERQFLAEARREHEKDFVGEDNPLISVTIATYNRGDLLVQRTLPSVLNQTYGNFEIVIVGDGCTDDTGEQIERLGDPRIRFINSPRRGKYPEDPVKRWMVAGVPPINLALDEARGLWFAHLDDDDVFEPHHLETLLRFAQKGQFEFVYSQMNKQTGIDSWDVIGSAPSDRWRVPHSCAFFRNYLRLFKFDINAWKSGITADRHVWVRMASAGVRAGFVQKVTTTSPLRPNTTSYKHQAEDRE